MHEHDLNFYHDLKVVVGWVRSKTQKFSIMLILSQKT